MATRRLSFGMSRNALAQMLFEKLWWNFQSDVINIVKEMMKDLKGDEVERIDPAFLADDVLRKITDEILEEIAKRDELSKRLMERSAQNVLIDAYSEWIANYVRWLYRNDVLPMLREDLEYVLKESRGVEPPREAKAIASVGIEGDRLVATLDEDGLRHDIYLGLKELLSKYDDEKVREHASEIATWFAKNVNVSRALNNFRLWLRRRYTDVFDYLLSEIVNDMRGKIMELARKYAEELLRRRVEELRRYRETLEGMYSEIGAKYSDAEHGYRMVRDRAIAEAEKKLRNEIDRLANALRADPTWLTIELERRSNVAEVLDEKFRERVLREALEILEKRRDALKRNTYLAGYLSMSVAERCAEKYFDEMVAVAERALLEAMKEVPRIVAEERAFIKALLEEARRFLREHRDPKLEELYEKLNEMFRNGFLNTRLDVLAFELLDRIKKRIAFELRRNRRNAWRYAEKFEERVRRKARKYAEELLSKQESALKSSSKHSAILTEIERKLREISPSIEMIFEDIVSKNRVRSLSAAERRTLILAKMLANPISIGTDIRSRSSKHVKSVVEWLAGGSKGRGDIPGVDTPEAREEYEKIRKLYKKKHYEELARYILHGY